MLVIDEKIITFDLESREGINVGFRITAKVREVRDDIRDQFG